MEMNPPASHIFPLRFHLLSFASHASINATTQAKKMKLSIRIMVAGLIAGCLHAQSPYSALQIPKQIQYQGRVATGTGGAWSGTEGYFVFALLSGPPGSETVLWNNWNGNSSPAALGAAYTSPGSAQVLTLPVSQGVFSVRLGDPTVNIDANKEIPATVFFDTTSNSVRAGVNGSKLAVWFSPDGGTFTRLSPDVEFASVPFAMVSGIAETVKERAISTEMLANGAVKGQNVASGTIDSTKLAANTALANLGTNSIPGDRIVNGSITFNQLATNSVGSATIIFSAVGTEEIADGAIQSQDFAGFAKAPYANVADEATVVDNPEVFVGGGGGGYGSIELQGVSGGFIDWDRSGGSTDYDIRLQSTGLDTLSLIGGTIVTSSDERMKTNIRPIGSALDKLMALRGVHYDWRAECQSRLGFSKKEAVGVIAQEVRSVLPEAVSEDQEGYLSVNYEALIPLLIEAVKEQQMKIKSLESRIDTLTAE
jgi:hypothetical protein